MQPVLVACSHGTASTEGRLAVSGLVAAVAARRPDLDVREAFVDVQHPTPMEVLAQLRGQPARVVPLLLSAGYHVHVDLTAATAAAHEATLSRALGPDDRLSELLAVRLAEAGLRADDHVVMAAAGSSDTSALADCATLAGSLARRIDRPVRVAYLSAAQPTLTEAVEAVRPAGGRVVVATYLLAPGFFTRLAAQAGADLVTAPLLVPGRPAPAQLVDIVLDRFDEASR